MILKSNDENLKHKVCFYLKSIEIQATFQIISLLVLSHNQISRPQCQTPTSLSQLKEIIVSITIKRIRSNKEKLDKNISIYQDLIAFSWASISFKKKKDTLLLLSS